MNRLAVVAYHEAGHALAARLRGAQVLAVSLEPGFVTWQLPQTPQKLFRNGQRIDNPEPAPVPHDDGFTWFAGSWAQVRAQVPASDPGFTELVVSTLKDNTHDYAGYLAAQREPEAEAQWSAELEQHWPYLHRVATALYREHLDKLAVQREKRRRMINRQRAQRLPPVQNRRTVDRTGVVTVGS